MVNITGAVPEPLRVAVVGVITVVISACSSTGKVTAQRAVCDHSGRDSVFAVGGLVYRDCAVDRAAKLLTSDIHPEFHPTNPRAQCYSADVEFVVDTMGKPELATARLGKANDDEFATSMLAVLARWKYDPAILDGKRVRQIVSHHQAVSLTRVVVAPGSSLPSQPPRSLRQSC